MEKAEIVFTLVKAITRNSVIGNLAARNFVDRTFVVGNYVELNFGAF